MCSGTHGTHVELVFALVADLRRLRRVCGGAILEIGEDQADKVAAHERSSGLAVARSVRDVGGAERVIVLQPA